MMRPWPILLALVLMSSVWLAPKTVRADLPFDVITVSHPDSNTTVWRIAQPNVKRQKTPYFNIRFKAGDEIIVDAGGCAQTGGYGRTWKSYTNPRGSSADVYYSGTIYIPAVIPLGPDGGYQRIGGQINKVLRVPKDLPPTIKPSELILNLGYQDNGYDDNGYWGHDDGNDDQCKGVGAAWVVVKVISQPPTPVAEFTPWSKPFDVTWLSDSIDANGLPVNPFWAGQIDPNGVAKGDPSQQLPNFVKDCGPAFSWNWGAHGLDEDVGVMAAKCSSQAPTTDLDHSAFVEPCCYCHPQPLDGHLDWLYATYSGMLYWEDFSGGWPNDGDINFQLRPTGSAGLTDQNGASIGLEFNDSETIDNFTLPLWKTIRNDAENGGDADLEDRLNGRFAMVTGLMGIDGVHGGYTELHPVMALAVCIKGCTVMQSDNAQTPIVEGADQTWLFFLQNYGNGGNCSSSEHFWPGLPAQGEPTKAWYFLSLPRPPGAGAVTLTSQEIGASETVGSTLPAQWKDWTYVGFKIPAPTGDGGAQIDGQFTIHYAFPKPPPQHKALVVAGRPQGHVDEGADLKDVLARVTDPATRGRLASLIQGTPPVRATPRLHAVSLTLTPNAGADAALAMITPQRARMLTRDHPYVNPLLLQQKHAFLQQMVQILPLQLAPGQIKRPVLDGAAGGVLVNPATRPTMVAPEAAPQAPAAKPGPTVRPARVLRQIDPAPAPQS